MRGTHSHTERDTQAHRVTHTEREAKVYRETQTETPKYRGTHILRQTSSSRKRHTFITARHTNTHTHTRKETNINKESNNTLTH